MILHVHMCDFSFVWCFPFQGRVGGISTLFKRAALPTLLSLRSPTHAEGGISTGVPESCNRKAWPFADSIICHLPVTKTWFVRYRLKLQPFLSLPRLCTRSESATKKEKQHSTATFPFQWCPLFVCFDLLCDLSACPCAVWWSRFGNTLSMARVSSRYLVE